MRIFMTRALLLLVIIAAIINPSAAQQYKLRQTTTIVGMKSESTIYVKGPRKRTEGGGNIITGTDIVSIEQCDLQRTIRINDKKKLYFILPFSKETEEVINDDDKPVPAVKKVPAKPDTTKALPRKGGIVNTWYSITDTGERKKIFGLTARHVWTYQKMKPSPDACYMKDSLIIKTDGWYIDLPRFNCPAPARASQTAPNQKYEPDCKDRYITHRSGKGKLGFPLEETTTIIMGNANPQTSDFTTSISTLELSEAKLDSMLFEIPPGYQLAASEDDLHDKMKLKDIVNQAKASYEKAKESADPTEPPKAGMIKIGVLPPTGGDASITETMQQHLVSSLTSGKVIAIAIANPEEGKKYNCTYSLSTDFQRFKQASKIGGLLKAIKNTDPNAASAYNIDASLALASLSGGSAPPEQKVSGKFEGKLNEAANKALDEGSGKILNVLR